jgi:hypothetical protein
MGASHEVQDVALDQAAVEPGEPGRLSPVASDVEQPEVHAVTNPAPDGMSCAPDFFELSKLEGLRERCRDHVRKRQ